MSNAAKDYIVWNGAAESLYVENDIHDCIVTDDLQTISVQAWRKELIDDGLEPIVLFACKAAGSSISTGHGGAFTLSYTKQFTPQKTLRALVAEINDDVAHAGCEQRAEVICRADLLDVPIDDLPKFAGCATALMTFDMCRPRPDDEQGE
jgi:hypothetical protein